MAPDNEFPLSNPVFYRTYSRFVNGKRETWEDTNKRTTDAIAAIGKFDEAEKQLSYQLMAEKKVFYSGRWLWVGGSEWLDIPGNNYGAYNCTSMNINTINSFTQLMSLSMQGVGTGSVLNAENLSKLPKICSQLKVSLVDAIAVERRNDRTEFEQINNYTYKVIVGDSRQGWCNAINFLLDCATNKFSWHTTEIYVDLSNIRPKGARLKGFGGVANPVKLPELFIKAADIINGAYGRQLTATEACLLLDEMSVAVVAGNIRRSASMRQGDHFDLEFASSKDNLWQQQPDGSWIIDPKRDALRVANHTLLYHTKPNYHTILESVRKQYYSGEGAIMYVPEALYRTNIDLVNDFGIKPEMLRAAIESGNFKEFLTSLKLFNSREIEHRLKRYGTNPCATADTWVMTQDGARQISDLVGVDFAAVVDGQVYYSTKGGFWSSGVKPVYEISFKDGRKLKLTANHEVLKVVTSKANEWTEVKNLVIGDNVKVHNHRTIYPWTGDGNESTGYLVGQLLGDGCLNKTDWNDNANLRFWGPSQEFMAAHVRKLLQSEFDVVAQGCYNQSGKYINLACTQLATLAAKYGMVQGNKHPDDSIERTSYAFYIGFIRGLFDADGTVLSASNGTRSIRLNQSDLPLLERIQRMLSRLGINSTIYLRRGAQERLLPDSNKEPKLYLCKDNYELIISRDNITRYNEIIGFVEPAKAEKLAEVLHSYYLQPRKDHFDAQVVSIELIGEREVFDCTIINARRYDANGLVISNCGEILGSDFLCNLSEVHLNQFDPCDWDGLKQAFKAAALSVCALLHHRFDLEKMQYSRHIDPIVGVSFTGLFDYFVNYFGVKWLKYWELGRPDTPEFWGIRSTEQSILSTWKSIVEDEVFEYCTKHGLKVPNRCTTVQPAGTKSLLTGASPGWHAPKAARFLRRVTFGAYDPVALASMDMGYNVVPSQSDKDENGRLLDDPFDPRVKEWLVEYPVQANWADLPGVDEIDISKFSACAQFDFFMMVQNSWTAHNTSATIELREDEIEPLAKAIHKCIQNDGGYVSAALMARFDSLETFPRLPFEPISKATYERLTAEVMTRRKANNFAEALEEYDLGVHSTGTGAAPCDSDKCLLPEKAPN